VWKVEQDTRRRLHCMWPPPPVGTHTGNRFDRSSEKQASVSTRPWRSSGSAADDDPIGLQSRAACPVLRVCSACNASSCCPRTEPNRTENQHGFRRSCVRHTATAITPSGRPSFPFRSLPMVRRGAKLLGKKGGRGCLTLARDDKP
jgi:hypothetical protein